MDMFLALPLSGHSKQKILRDDALRLNAVQLAVVGLGCLLPGKV